MNTILIIEDEKTIVDIMAFNLKREGFAVLEAYDGPSGLELALTPQVDLVLLDMMLPGMDGFAVLSRIRAHSAVPVIMVTAREEEADKVQCLENGADDYITKPFSLKELTARIRANMRRTQGGMAVSAGQDAFGPFSVDREMQVISKNGRVLELTQREYDILCYFFSAPGRVISREELMEKVWGYDYYGDLRAIDVAMRRLREKLEDDPANPSYIVTKRGAGYYFSK